ncbi:DUF488 domain-containing protein [Niallia sp. Krafla_26]|uniref:DUF488 domain-containing protein n=1 Tax=Niallia sp. Krafla_26 TaxID=3064703 RepID=UPI003D17A7D6
MDRLLLKRIYEPYDEMDGERILIDRLWPRGISKEDAKLTTWAKDIAPSSELRKWFCHKPELFEEFKQKYIAELRHDGQKSRLLSQLCQLAEKKRITLLYGAKDPVYNHAVVLKEEIIRKMAES